MKFRLSGTDIKISFLFAAGLAYIISTPQAQSLIVLVFSALMHEIAHLAALISYGEKPREINIGIFGMEIRRTANVRLSYIQECVSAIAGPAMSLAIAALLFIFTLLIKTEVFIYPATSNLMLAVFNLLPITPLDGGRALHFYLCKKYPQEKAQRISDAAGIGTLFPLSVLGFTVLIRSGYNFSLLAACVYLGAFFLLQQKRSLYTRQ